MPKNILIFSDGTGQAGGMSLDQNLSNIYKLFRASRVDPGNPIDPKDQVAFYDAGLGTQRDEGRIHVRALQAVRKAISAGIGVGVSRNIADCYEAILKYYEPGDRVFLFGFSRGAYTARCVAGVMNLCGIPTRSPDGGCLPRCGKDLRAIADEAVRSVYEHGAGRERAKFEPEREEVARWFKSRYGSDLGGKANVAPYFIGVFDTVAALGAKGLKRFLLNTAAGAAILTIAACLALTEHLFGLDFMPSFMGFCAALIALVLLSSLRYSLRVIHDYPNPGESRWHLAGWHSGFYDRYLDKQVRYARHALAIDETREDFARVPWGVKGDIVVHDAGEPEWLQQIWFAGGHSDIGGSYEDNESRLSDIALSWMVEQITALPHSVLLDSSKLHFFPDPGGVKHSEVEAVRDFYPRWIPKSWRLSCKEKP